MIKLRGARFLVLKDEEQDRVYGGGIIVRKGVVYDRLIPATVIGVGPLCTRYNVRVKDRILVGAYVGTQIMIDDVEHWIIREHDAVAKILEE